VDPAYSEAGDECVWIVRGDRAIHDVVVRRGVKKEEALKITFRLIEQYPGITKVCVDAVNYGEAIADDLYHMLDPRIRLVRVIAGSRASNAVRWGNQRAEAWGAMRDALDYFMIPSKMVDYPLLDRFLECTDMLYKLGKSDGRTYLELKTDFRERVGHSPDLSDAIANSFAEPVGDPAFPMLDPRLHHMGLRPYLVLGERSGVYGRALRGAESVVGPTVGVLARTTWFGQADRHACLVCHIDDEKCVTVLDLFQGDGAVESFWAKVSEAYPSDRFRFKHDLFSLRDDPYREDWVHDMDTILRRTDRRRVPLYVPPANISGTAALGRLAQMLLSTLACDPAADWWRVRPADLKAYDNTPALFIWPAEVYHALEHARRLSASVGQTDLAADVPEGLVGDGGAIVRALRLLLVSGAGR
jgi:hypothetical protein